MDIESSVVTHNGPFHADEIVAIAQLLLAKRVDKVIRSRDAKVIQEANYVVDVGGIYDPTSRRFDHHQQDYKGEHSSAGLVGQFLKNEGFYDEETYLFLKKRLLDHVDAFDNGRVSKEILQVETFSSIIEMFVPPKEECLDAEMEFAFDQALDFAKGHIQRLLNRFEYERSCREYIQGVMQSCKEILFFDRAVPWLDNFFALGGQQHRALFIVMPTKEGWKLRVIPDSLETRMGARLLLPEEWGGKIGVELENASGIPGAIFCHKGRFIAFFKTKEGALAAAQSALQLGGIG